jgi:ParB-like chromosome segregation protein Spo0J
MSKKPAAKKSSKPAKAASVLEAAAPVVEVETPAPAAPDLGPSEILAIPMDKIDLAPKAEQVRAFDPEDAEYQRKVEFAATNRKWLSNIIVTKAEGGRYVLRAGRNRFEASKVNGWLEIEARVYGEMDVSTAICVGLMENIGAKSMTKLEMASAMAAVMRRDPKATIQSFASRMSVTKNTVRNILSLNNLIPDAAKATTKGSISLANAYQLATLPADIQTDWIESAQTTKTLKFVKAVQDFLKDLKGDKTGTTRAASKDRAKKAPKVIKPLGQTELETMLSDALKGDPEILGPVNESYQDGLIDGLMIALGRKPRMPASSQAGFQPKAASPKSL